MEKLARQLTIKYSFMQITYWISQCCINSFAAVYLQSKNFNNTQIGIVLALAAVFSIILQPAVAAFADKTQKISLRYIVVSLMLIVFIMTFFLIVLPKSILLIAVIFVLVNAIQFTLVPLFNSLALEYLNLGIPMNYGLARGMGSIFFAVISSSLGYMVNYFGAGILISLFLGSYVFVILSAVLFKIPVNSYASLPKPTDNKKPETKNKNTPELNGILYFFVKYRKFSFLLIGIAMLFYSHSLINTYLINIMEHAGGSSKDMGVSLGIAAALELPTMALFIFIVRKISCNKLMKIAAFFFLVKVIITWIAPNVMTVHISQGFQMLAFALYTPASVYYVNSIVDENDRVKGQSMLGVAGTGIAGTVANISGGKILDTFGVSNMLLIGTIVTAIGFLIVCLATENPESEDKKMKSTKIINKELINIE